MSLSSQYPRIAEFEMRDDDPIPRSDQSADWFPHSQRPYSISRASPALLAPQPAFVYAILAWLFVGGVVLPLGAWWLPGPAPACQAEPLALRFGNEASVNMSLAS